MIAIAGGRAIERAHALGDHRRVPLAAILLAQQEQRAFGVDARGKARGVQQHQRQQRPGARRRDRRMRRDHARQPDRLAGDVVSDQLIA